MLIGFDESHKDPKYFSIDDEDENGFVKLAELLSGHGFELVQLTDPLTTLEADILVVAFPVKKVLSSEVETIG